MSKTVKIWFCIVSGVLLTIAVMSFTAACMRGCSQMTVEHTKVQVYINDNDSIVEQLKLDIKKLTELIERMETDSFTVEIKRMKKGSNSNNRNGFLYK